MRYLLEGPNKELAFMPLGIRILTRIKPAIGMSHLPQNVVKNAFSDITRPIVSRHLIIMQVKTRQEGIVIQHLLKVRYQPLRVCRITMKSTSQLIIHTAIGHFAAGVTNNFERFFFSSPIKMAQQKLERHCRRKLRCSAKTSLDSIVTHNDSTVRLVEQILGKRLTRFACDAYTAKFFE